MRAEVLYHSDGTARVIPLPAGKRGAWIECRVIDPPSRAGQSVELWVPDVAELLLGLRYAAVRERAVAEPEAASREG